MGKSTDLSKMPPSVWGVKLSQFESAQRSSKEGLQLIKVRTANVLKLMAMKYFFRVQIVQKGQMERHLNLQVTIRVSAMEREW